jgi:hypothetical protein
MSVIEIFRQPPLYRTEERGWLNRSEAVWSA